LNGQPLAAGGGVEQQLRAALDSTRARESDLQRAHARIVAASEDSNADDEHDPEGSTIAFERAQNAALLADAVRARTRLEEALDRLAAGSYGACQRCGGPIAAARLAARPDAETCITCATARR
jgi:RNA polymerase-binding transcription factor DksA